VVVKVLPKERDPLRPRISVCKCMASGGTTIVNAYASDRMHLDAGGDPKLCKKSFAELARRRRFEAGEDPPSIPRHEHLGAGEYYVVGGKMEVRGGVENGGITAITGYYGYEPNGVIHDTTNFPKDTVLYFTNFGPIRYIDDDDNTTGFLDWQGVLKAAEQAEAKIT